MLIKLCIVTLEVIFQLIILHPCQNIAAQSSYDYVISNEPICPQIAPPSPPPPPVRPSCVDVQVCGCVIHLLRQSIRTQHLENVGFKRGVFGNVPGTSTVLWTG